jgi:hypothetical protein
MSLHPAGSEARRQGRATTVAPELLERTGTFQARLLRESSGVAASRRYPGVLWTHNDSGDGPRLYATNLAGADLGFYRVAHATAVDWEDMALGPCPGGRGIGCLYVADLGDNAEHRHGGTIYVVTEPAPPTGPGDTSRVIELVASLRVRYADGSHDTEGIMVSPTGDVSLITKGWSGPILHYWLPHDVFSENAVTVAPHDTLAIRPLRNAGRLVTGAAISPSGLRAVVRTYTELYFYRVQGAQLVAQGLACWLGPVEPQGEGVDFLDEDSLVLTSEGVLGESGTIYRVRCPRQGPD